MNRDSHLADVVVVGAGPVGLLLSAKLGQQLNVCLLERDKIGRTSKFWLTTDKRLARHELSGVVRHRCTRATVGTFLRSPAVAAGNFSVVDEFRLLDRLRAKCESASVTMVEGAKVLSAAVEDNLVAVRTTQGLFRTRLVLDASGGSSPFAQTFRLHHLEGFYSIYGAHLEDVDLASNDIVGAHIVHFGHPSPLFEVIPTGPRSAFCAIFVAAQAVIAPETLDRVFWEHVRHNPFLAMDRDVELGEAKMGVIPIGRCARRPPRGILPVGEAGMLQSPLLGAAFNEALECGDLIVESILNEFRRDLSRVLSPHPHVTLGKRTNDRVQLFLARRLVRGNLSSFDHLVSFLQRLGPTRSYKLFCTELEWSDLPAVVRATLL